jgi:hypothetical protein
VFQTSTQAHLLQVSPLEYHGRLQSLVTLGFSGYDAERQGRHREAAEVLAIPEPYVQAGLLPVARLSGPNRFSPAPREPLASVIAYDRFSSK